MYDKQRTLPVGCSTICFGSDPLAGALARIARLGFEVIELGVVGSFCNHYQPYPVDPELRRRTVAAVQGSGLLVSAVNAVPWICVPDPDDAAQVRAATDEVMALAAALGAALILPSGMRRPGAEASAARELAEAYRRGRDDFGVSVSVEAPHKGALAETTAETVRLLELADEPGLGIAYDCSHVVHAGSDAESSLAALGTRISHVHARDARGQDIHHTPGDGEFDWDRLIDHLAGQGFGGPLTLELEYEGRLTPEQVEAEAVRAREFLAARVTARIDGTARVS